MKSDCYVNNLTCNDFFLNKKTIQIHYILKIIWAKKDRSTQKVNGVKVIIK